MFHCHNLLSDLDRSTIPSKWRKRGFQPQFFRELSSPLARVAELCRNIREETDEAKRERLERKFQRLCVEHDEGITHKFKHRPAKGIAGEERLTILFPNQMKGAHTVPDIEARTRIYPGIIRKWLMEAGDGVICHPRIGKTPASYELGPLFQRLNQA
jgi:hypothetical protein